MRRSGKRHGERCEKHCLGLGFCGRVGWSLYLVKGHSKLGASILKALLDDVGLHLIDK